MSFHFRETPVRRTSGDKRIAPRQRSNVKVTIECAGRTVPGKIHDLSMTGMQVIPEGFIMPAVGANIFVKAREIGAIEGIVRWVSNNRIGLQFSANSASVAQVQSYFRFYHKQA